jgi:NADH-quinone oxidoreductase subunit J
MMLAAVDWSTWFFYLMAALACGFAVAVVLSNHIVHMAFFLTLSLGATAGLFFLSGSAFVGAMQFMIYVGGTLVLLVFGVMLTAQRRFVAMQTQAWEWIAAAILGGSLLVLLWYIAWSVPDWYQKPPPFVSAAQVETTSRIGLALSGVRPDSTPDKVRSGYALPFVIVSVHLLVVLIGAGYLARARRPVSATVRGG